MGFDVGIYVLRNDNTVSEELRRCRMEVDMGSFGEY